MMVWIWLGPLLGGLVTGLLVGLRPMLILAGVVLAIELGIFLYAYSVRDFVVAWGAVIALIAPPIYGGAMLLVALLGANLRSDWRAAGKGSTSPGSGETGTA